MMKRLKLVISGILIGLIITAFCLAKPERPELWEEVFVDGKTVYSVELNHIICEPGYGCYLFLMRTYHPKDGYKIYSCSWWPNLNGFSWALRWIGSEYTDKRAALRVHPDLHWVNTEGNKLSGAVLPLKPWQEAVSNYVTDDVMLHPEFITFIDNIDNAPFLPNYPYANGRRR